MDPLSVIASVAGIATAAGEVVKILGPYITAAKDAPKIAAQMSSEALATQTILSALEQLASNFSTGNRTYASLIQVDQLIAVLTDGVLIFSELHAVLQTLPPPEPINPAGRLWSPMQWVRKKDSLAAILTRLQSFKLSISCILSILQSDSQARAENQQEQLRSTVEKLLECNLDLSKRIMGMESTFNTMSHRQATLQLTAGIDSLEPHITSNRSSLFEFEFERDLKASRVYRRAKRDTMDFSFRSSVARTHTWSIFSGISLSNISEISVLALPLYAEDVANPQHYQFGHDTFQPKPLLSQTVIPNLRNAPSDGSVVAPSLTPAAQVIALAREAMRNVLENEEQVVDTNAASIGLKSWVSINLSRQGIQDLPEEVIDIMKDMVERLALSRNKLSNLPARFSEFTSLWYLNIRRNYIKEFPMPLCDLKSLEILDLGKNQLRVLPSNISKLSSLKILSVEGNQIRELPLCLADMVSLQVLKFEDNPISFPPKHALDFLATSPPIEKDSDTTETILTDSDKAVVTLTARIKTFLKQHAQACDQINSDEIDSSWV